MDSVLFLPAVCKGLQVRSVALEPGAFGGDTGREFMVAFGDAHGVDLLLPSEDRVDQLLARGEAVGVAEAAEASGLLSR